MLPCGSLPIIVMSEYRLDSHSVSKIVKHAYTNMKYHKFKKCYTFLSVLSCSTDCENEFTLRYFVYRIQFSDVFASYARSKTHQYFISQTACHHRIEYWCWGPFKCVFFSSNSYCPFTSYSPRQHSWVANCELSGVLRQMTVFGAPMRNVKNNTQTTTQTTLLCFQVLRAELGFAFGGILSLNF